MAQVLHFPARPWRILVIDDSPGVERLLRKMLDASGIRFDLSFSDTLDGALRDVCFGEWDLVLLDSWMPPHTSFETPLFFIRQAGYAGPVVLLSADAAEKAGPYVDSGQLQGAIAKQDLCPKTLLGLRDLSPRDDIRRRA